MLLHIHIKDLAIIHEVELSPGPGLNILTGETGAGKSIIVGAAGLLLGGRASADIVRKGQREAVVEALFDLTSLPNVARAVTEAGLPLEGEELLLRRVISRAGRGRVHVNGALCTLAVLRGITRELLDISGQHEHQLLSDRARQRRILDALALGAGQIETMARRHAELGKVSSRLAQGRQEEKQQAERQDFLAYQLRELEGADLRQGEDEQLALERERLQRASELTGVALEGEEDLYGGDGSVSERLALLRRRLEELAHLDPALPGLAGQLEEAGLQVEDVAHSLRRLGAAAELDPARLEQVEARLDLLHRLGRKHGRTVAEMLARQEKMQAELARLESLEHHLHDLESNLEKKRKASEKEAKKVENKRRKAARKLAAEVTDHLTRLRMEGARLKVDLSALQARDGDDPALVFADRRLASHGWDSVEFLMATNPGEDPKPLARIASGGELSRVMLALHRVLGEYEPRATAVYDEVDAGVGGAVADVVGRYLADVSAHRQVLCVTHLPQVAAHAAHHFHVDKTVARRGKKARARTRLRTLDPAQQVEELARMLGGEEVTEEARANARRLLETAAGS